MHACMHTCLYVCVCGCVCVCVCVCNRCTCMYKCVSVCVIVEFFGLIFRLPCHLSCNVPSSSHHSYIDTCVHAHMYVHTHVNIHTGAGFNRWCGAAHAREFGGEWSLRRVCDGPGPRRHGARPVDSIYVSVHAEPCVMVLDKDVLTSGLHPVVVQLSCVCLRVPVYLCSCARVHVCL